MKSTGGALPLNAVALLVQSEFVYSALKSEPIEMQLAKRLTAKELMIPWEVVHSLWSELDLLEERGGMGRIFCPVPSFLYRYLRYLPLVVVVEAASLPLMQRFKKKALKVVRKQEV